MSFEAAIQGEDNIRKGPWFEEEDELLTSFVTLLGDRRWDSIAKASGLRRSGKSCRLRWKNYLRPNLKRGNITAEEERIILQLHAKWGNKWSRIAQNLPERTDNEIKNYWRTHLKKKEPAADQEQENKMDNATPSSQEYYSNSQHKFIEDVLRTSQNNAEGSSNLTSTGTNIPDWISELSNDQSFEHYGNSNYIESIDSSLCYSDMFSDNNNIHLWDYSCSLWDIV